jgi:hypothetical protein
MKNIIMIVLISLTTINCNDGCELNDLDCNGDVLEICDSANNWQEVIDCRDVFDVNTGDLEKWQCCYDSEIDDFSCSKECQ